MPTKELILRYFRGECTQEEIEVVESYLALGIDEDYVNSCLSEVANQLLSEDTYLDDVDIPQQWSLFAHRIQRIPDEKESSGSIDYKTNRKVPFINKYVVYALAAALLAIASFVGVQLFRTVSLPDFVIVKTDLNQSKKIVLPDSTVVWMSASTQLRYTAGFGKDHRNIELTDGEAYFDVHHNATLPFIVKAKQTDTKVLGTAFLITSYRTLGYTDIQVTRGKVNVVVDKKLYSGLTKGDGVYCNESENKNNSYKFERAKFDPDSESIFLQGVSFQELAMRIESLYGYKLVAGTSAIGKQRYTTQIDPREDIQDLLSNISWMHHGTYEIIGKEVFMY